MPKVSHLGATITDMLAISHPNSTHYSVATLEAISETDLQRLVGAPETEWFDAKREPYGNSDGQRRDVAAFANRQGGLIIIGLDEGEGEGGTIVGLTPQSDTTLAGEELRMTQIISSLVTPVPAFAVVRVADGRD